MCVYPCTRNLKQLYLEHASTVFRFGIQVEYHSPFSDESMEVFISLKKERENFNLYKIDDITMYVHNYFQWELKVF